MTGIRRLLIAATAGTVVFLGGAVVAAAAVDEVPVITGITPTSVVANGQPIHLTVTGQHLGGVVQAVLSPFVAQRSVVILNDNSVLVVLPPSLPPGVYSLRLETPTTGSDPSSAPTFTVTAAPSNPLGSLPPPPRPVGQGTFAPLPSADATPAATPRPSHRVPAPAAPAAASSSSIVDPLVALVIGLGAGGVAWVLWGNGDRMRVARRQDLLAQLVGRPAQRLRLGRICLYCGRLHWLWTTPRQLWRGGHFCSDRCVAAADAEAILAREADAVAPTRLREVVVYQELERRLLETLAAELQERGVDAGLRAAEVLASLRDRREGATATRPGPAVVTLDDVAREVDRSNGAGSIVPSASVPEGDDLPLGQPLPL